MDTKIRLIPLSQLTKIKKSISAPINQKEIITFIKTLSEANGYIISTDTKAYLIYNEFIKEYEIILFEAPKNDFIMECEIFTKAYELFDIPQNGWRVFIYQKGIYLYLDGVFRYYKIFDMDFEIEDLDEFIVKNYGLGNFEYTYIRQAQYDELLKSIDIKSSCEFYRLKNKVDLFGVLMASSVVLIAVSLYLVSEIINKTNDEVVLIEDVPTPQELTAVEPKAIDKAFSKTLNELFINLNTNKIILQDLSLKNGAIIAVVNAKDKEKLLNFANEYSKIRINKIIYDKLQEIYSMEFEIVQGTPIL